MLNRSSSIIELWGRICRSWIVEQPSDYPPKSRYRRVSFVWLTAIGAISLCLVNAAQAANKDEELHAAWEQYLSHTPAQGIGCYTAKYPSRRWAQVACVTAPNRPNLPAHAPEGYNVGNGNDYAGRTSGILYSSEGRFPEVTGLETETNDGAANQYTLQLNSQKFASPTCAHAQNPATCRGWQQ